MSILVLCSHMQAALTYQVAPFDKQDAKLRPAVFLLHGRGADEEDLMTLAPHLDPAFICIAPRAPFPFANGGYMWYDIRDIAQPDETQFNESCDRLRTFIDEMQKEYPVDLRRIYLLGFSMGAVVAYALALAQPEKIRGIVAHSGYWPEHLSHIAQQQNLTQSYFFVAHGIHDPVIPIEYGRRVKELLTRHNARLEYREYPIQHQISDQSLNDLNHWLTHNLSIAP